MEESGSEGHMNIVAALVLMLMVVLIAWLINTGGTRGGVNATPIVETGEIKIIAADAMMSYTLGTPGIPDSMEYRVDVNAKLVSEEAPQVIFVIRFKDYEKALPCITGGTTAPGGSGQIPCNMNPSGDTNFYLTANFGGIYGVTPPIINISRFASTHDSKINPGGKYLKIMPGQTLIVGNYSVKVSENPLYEIDALKPLSIETGVSQYRVTVRCKDSSKFFNMDADERKEIPLCGGLIVIDVKKLTARYAYLYDGLRIDTYRGNEWHGKGEKVELYVWKYFDGFDCGGYAGPYEPFDIQSAETDDRCLKELAVSKILWAPAEENLDAFEYLISFPQPV